MERIEYILRPADRCRNRASASHAHRKRRLLEAV